MLGLHRMFVNMADFVRREGAQERRESWNGENDQRSKGSHHNKEHS